MLKVLQGNEEIIMDFCDTFAIHFNTTYSVWYLLIQCVNTQFLGANNSVLIKVSPSWIAAGEKKESLGNWYHPLCLKCKKCGRQLAKGSHAEVRFLPHFRLISPYFLWYRTKNNNTLALLYSVAWHDIWNQWSWRTSFSSKRLTKELEEISFLRV